DRELEALVHPDRTPEYDALPPVADGATDRGAPEAQRLGGDQQPLGVEPIEQVREAPALLADAVGVRHLEVVDEQLVGVDGLAAHLRDRADLDVVAEIGRASCRESV